MISRFVAAAAITFLSLAFAVPAEAGWLGDFVHSVARDAKRRNCWPQPFLSADRHDARAPFAIMVNNGWRRQNMLGDHHFDEFSGELTEAGKLKIRWILTEAPLHHRDIYVHRAEAAEKTLVRLDNVQRLAASLVPEGELPAVLETSISTRGWPASQVDAIGRRFESSMPNPRLSTEAVGSE